MSYYNLVKVLLVNKESERDLFYLEMVRLEMGEREDDPAQEEFQDYQVDDNINIFKTLMWSWSPNIVEIMSLSLLYSRLTRDFSLNLIRSTIYYRSKYVHIIEVYLLKYYFKSHLIYK